MLSRVLVSQVKHNSWFVAGAALGLWLALVAIPLDDAPPLPCAASSASVLPAALDDDLEPIHEQRVLGTGGAVRSVTRPRYYSSELGMRAALLTAVLVEKPLDERTAALNSTLAALHPALKFLVAAGGEAAKSEDGGRYPNVVLFTDTRALLRPFHALKYLGDNYLEEYDFFFLVSEGNYVSARRLQYLASHLSVSQPLYMGVPSGSNSQYCSLEGGILVSNSVLRAVHAELDWCARNAYSAHHHENLGRCLLHAAAPPCTQFAQGESYSSVQWESAWHEADTSSATVRGLQRADQYYTLHAKLTKELLVSERVETERLRRYIGANTRRHPPGYRNVTWPAGLRADAGLAPPKPLSRWELPRWVWFNTTHGLMADDHNAATLLPPYYVQATQAAIEEAGAWACSRRGIAHEECVTTLVEGAWRWMPPTALTYRLLLDIHSTLRGKEMVMLECVRGIGSARLVGVPYVTESARLHLVLPLPLDSTHLSLDVVEKDATDFIARYQSVARPDNNTSLHIVFVWSGDVPSERGSESARRLRELANKAGATVGEAGGAGRAADTWAGAGAAAWRAAGSGGGVLSLALPALPRDALVLVCVPHMEYSIDLLNRARMNAIAGVQWYLPAAWAKHPSSASLSASASTSGRFTSRRRAVLAANRADIDAGLAAAGSENSIAAWLAALPLQVIAAPEPALILLPRPPRRSPTAELGARHALAQLVLQHAATSAA